MKAFLSALLLAVLCVAGTAQARGGPRGGGHPMGPGPVHGPGGHFGPGPGPGGHFGPGPGGHFGPGPGPGGHFGPGPGGHFGPGPGPGPHYWGWGPGFYDDWDFLWLAGTTAYLYDSPYYYGYPAAPAVVYTPAYPSEPEPTTPIAAAPRFRYYCPGRGYYPQVQTCETDFIRKPIP